MREREEDKDRLFFRGGIICSRGRIREGWAWFDEMGGYSWALKTEAEPAFLMDKSSWFQCRIVISEVA